MQLEEGIDKFVLLRMVFLNGKYHALFVIFILPFPIKRDKYSVKSKEYEKFQKGRTLTKNLT